MLEVPGGAGVGVTRRSAGARMTWSAARTAAHGSLEPIAPRPVPLAEALGGTVAEDITSTADLPAFDRSAMDGYAVSGGPPWRVVGEVSLRDPGRALAPGEACGVVTGAPLGEGTQAVLPVEHARWEGPCLVGAVQVGQHIRRRGEECRVGDTVLAAGTPVSPVVLGFLAALGHDDLPLVAQPTVSGLVTGDELITSGRTAVGAHRDAIGPMLAGLCAMADGRLEGAPLLVADGVDHLQRAIVGSSADLVLVSGASSVGRSDHLRDALGDLGARFVVDGVDCRPGHPMAMALVDGRAVIGLPGNPLAALAAFWTLAAPAIARLQGRPLPELARLPLRNRPQSRAGTVLMPVTVRGGFAEPLDHRGAGMLRGAATADALAVVSDTSGEAFLIPLRPLPSSSPAA